MWTINMKLGTDPRSQVTCRKLWSHVGHHMERLDITDQFMVLLMKYDAICFHMTNEGMSHYNTYARAIIEQNNYDRAN